MPLLSSLFRLISQHPQRFFICALCRNQATVCSTCDRGQRYCSRSCAARARRESNRRAAARYQCSERGRVHHKLRQQRYLEAKMTQQSSCPPPGVSDSPSSACGPAGELTAAPPPASQTVSEADSAPIRRSHCCVCGVAAGPFVRTCFLPPIRRVHRRPTSSTP